MSSPGQRWRLAAVAADDASIAGGDEPGRVAAWARGIAHRDSAWARRWFGGVGGALVLALSVGFVGRESEALRSAVFPVATGAVLALGLLALGRYVRLSAGTYRRLALVSVVLLAFIIITGSAVRLTGSGLGCTDWPTCNGGKIVPQSGSHAWIEFGNRLVTDFCVLAAAIAALAAVVRVPYRRDLPRLGGLLIVAIMGNAVLGGFVVLTGLKPAIVMGHFLLAIVALAIGVLIFHRNGELGRSGRWWGGDRTPVLSRGAVLWSHALTLSALTTIVLGTVVTGSGPHGGDPGKVVRFGFNMRDVAKVHSLAAWLTVACTVALAWLAARAVGPGAERLRNRLTVLFCVLMVQGTVGYVQWFTAVPAKLVQLHVLGAVLMWMAVLWVRTAVTLAPGARPLAEVTVRADRSPSVAAI